MVTGFLAITPRPAERARRGKGRHMFNSATYIEYKKSLERAIIELKLTPDDYVHLEATFFVPYAATIKAKTNGELHRSKPDCDNYMKALKDSLSTCKVLAREIGKGKAKKISHDDSMIASENGVKMKINDTIGGIYFSLMREEEFFAAYGNPAERYF
jgi:Holliday junction resolvase RusA-like endonuclease